MFRLLLSGGFYMLCSILYVDVNYYLMYVQVLGLFDSFFTFLAALNVWLCCSHPHNPFSLSGTPLYFILEPPSPYP